MPNHFLLLRVVLFVTCAHWVFLKTGGSVLTMTSGEQCFGSRVELLCIHPDPLADPVNYLPRVIEWAENGTTIDFSDSRFTLTRVNSTASTLSFDVTEEDHRDRVILYTCFLVRNNANRDRDESDPLVINPIETTAAPVITSVPTSSSDELHWSHHSDCTNDYTFQFSIIWVSEDVVYDGMSSGNFTTDANKYNFSGLPQGNYSITIRAQCIECTFIVSEPVNVNFILTSELLISPDNPSGSPDIEGHFPVWIILVIVAVVLAVIILMVIIGLVAVCVCPKKSTTQPEKTVGDQSQGPLQHSMYVNVEMDDGSVPMTTNPSYERVELSSQQDKVHYANL